MIKEKLFDMNETLENITHQWRQPLSQINSTVSAIDKILYEKNIQDSNLEQKLQDIETLTKYMSNTLDDFKSHFTHNADKSEVSLAKIIEDAIINVEANFKENSIGVKCKLNSSYKYECYENQLQQIIIVLLNNAKDALLDRNTFRAKIEIELLQETNEYVIKIVDNAGGITKSVMQKIFEPYYTTKHNSQGTGIGLYMARKIIQEQYFGLLKVQNILSGSEFSIHLPRIKDK